MEASADLARGRALAPAAADGAVIALLQRVAEARVDVEGRVTGQIGQGLLVFVCAEPDDTDAIADRLVAKVLGCASSATPPAR